MKASVWSKFIRPALADKRGWSLATSTPEGRNWFYEQWRDGQDDGKGDWWSVRQPTWTNDVIFPGGIHDPEIIAMREELSQEKFNQEIGAEFTEYVGRVFKEFDEEVHVRNLDYNPRWPVYLALDYGFTNPFVALVIQVDHWDNVSVLKEWRTTHTTIEDIAPQLRDMWDGLATKAVTLYPDPADPGATRTLEKYLKVAATPRDTGGKIKDRLEIIRQFLKPVPEHVPEEKRAPKLLIDHSCINLIAEMGDKYRYPEKKSEEQANKEEPKKVDDHGPEALGRFFKGHYLASGKMGNERARVSRANITTRSRRRVAAR